MTRTGPNMPLISPKPERTWFVIDVTPDDSVRTNKSFAQRVYDALKEGEKNGWDYQFSLKSGRQVSMIFKGDIQT